LGPGFSTNSAYLTATAGFIGQPPRSNDPCAGAPQESAIAGRRFRTAAVSIMSAAAQSRYIARLATPGHVTAPPTRKPPTMILSRIANLFRGFMSLFLSGVERRNPEALLEVERENLRV